MKPDGFNLEQSILECWQVCEDLKYGKMDQQVLAKYYEVKFNQLGFLWRFSFVVL